MSGGWYRSTDSLDPASGGWEQVDVAEVLRLVSSGHQQAVELTAQMIGSCLNDGLGSLALHLVDVLIDEGFEISVSVKKDDVIRTT